MNPATDFVAANWSAPPHMRAGTTRRTGGVSAPPFDTLNLGMHVDDVPAAVTANRRALVAALDLPAEPVWLTQVHGTTVVDLDAQCPGEADAAIATRPDRVVAILTADCLPVVFCDRAGRCFGAAHAGWRGLAAGVLEATIEALPAHPRDLLAWLGPAIGPRRFEVGAEVRAAFVDAHGDDHVAFRETGRPGTFRADIHALARARLRRAGLHEVSGGDVCTVESSDFYSHRRDQGLTGRMATLVWSTAQV
ncbi:peptidoglycan editing factor PgeF [Salinisphaera sp. Q1T1-3]|uniref:peptidoglycan editing factor PgeF n=1 Tax=Salinisphaera sp. Q1T1-3 TaxID=2321229 RepID=UPI000E7080C0|nr:peptidoglycan editing factor PgeF [Salinisphaera sp. Q1T1-3]RJS92191.1 peptidoglycan editing factor PgeF [Salinisphaera sp. Q1T1-3]